MITAPNTNSQHLPFSSETPDALPLAEPNTASNIALIETHACRALIGFVPVSQALPILMGGRTDPGQEVSHHEQHMREMSEAVARRPVHQWESPEVQLDEALSDRVRSAPLVASHMANLNWRPGAVDLRKVGAYQPTINLHGLVERIAEVSDDMDFLLDFAIPRERHLQQLPVSGEQRQHSYTISSANPNLRVVGSSVGQAEVALLEGMPPINAIAIQYFVAINPSFMQVVHFDGRWFLRDGYHRAAALLQAGISMCPCLLVNAVDLSQFGMPDNHVPYDVLFGPRPPMLTDFWDDAVSAESTQPVVRKVVRTRADEFPIAG